MKEEHIAKVGNSKKSFIMIYVLLVLMICITGCTVRGRISNNDSSVEEESMKPSISTTTNLEVVVKLFPNLEGAETIEMEQLKYGGSSSPRSLPAPVDYQYRGYITLTEEASTKYTQNYIFTDAEPKISFEAIKERKGQWKYSYDFQKEIIKSGLVGDVWLDGNTLLFSIGTM